MLITHSFYQNYPPQLERLQTEHWDPLLDWIRKTFDATIIKNDSVLSNSQPDDTKKKLADVIAKFDHWELAGMSWSYLLEALWFILFFSHRAMERATYATKSFLIGLALVKRHLTVEQAALAATVEVSSQIERWGEVEDSKFETP